jgi:hypothetical protein
MSRIRDSVLALERRWLLVVICFPYIALASCREAGRDQALNARDSALQQREAYLQHWQDSLDIRARELSARERALDSLKAGRAFGIVDSTLVGDWKAAMTCTEAGCSGSAVGDTRTESWNLTYHSDTVVIVSKQKNALARVYVGSFDGTTLTARWIGSDTAATDMRLELRSTQPAVMNGTRTIDHRDAKCQVVYDIDLTRS